MHQPIVKKFPACAYGLVVASLLTLVAAEEAWAVSINPIPGAITCKLGEPGGVGENFLGFFDEDKGRLEINLEGFATGDCGPSQPGVEPPPPLPHPVEDHPVVIVDGVRHRTLGETDIALHGRYILHGMYGFVNDGVYGVYNLHGVYDVDGILHDATVYNFDRFGDAHPPILVPEPTAAFLFSIGLLGLLLAALKR